MAEVLSWIPRAEVAPFSRHHCRSLKGVPRRSECRMEAWAPILSFAAVTRSLRDLLF